MWRLVSAMQHYATLLAYRECRKQGTRETSYSFQRIQTSSMIFVRKRDVSTVAVMTFVDLVKNAAIVVAITATFYFNDYPICIYTVQKLLVLQNRMVKETKK